MSLHGYTNDAAVRRYKEAGDWLLSLNGEEVEEHRIAEWLRWCEDRENLAAFERMQQDWQDVVELKKRSTRHKTSRRRWMAAAAGVTAVVIGVALLAGPWRLSGSGEGSRAHVIAAADANRSATLPDGSLLTLSAQTSVNVDFTSQQRRLSLEEGGEAYFKVQRDRARPFVVEAGELTVTAIGTAFDVRYKKDRVQVTVEEGVVNVSAPGAQTGGAPAQWTAVAGHRLEYSGKSGSAVIAGIDAAKSMRWRAGEFAYVSAPLSEVVSEVNKYLPAGIEVADPAVGAIPYTGTVFVASIDEWLEALATRYPVRAARTPDGRIVLHSPEHR